MTIHLLKGCFWEWMDALFGVVILIMVGLFLALASFGVVMAFLLVTGRIRL